MHSKVKRTVKFAADTEYLDYEHEGNAEKPKKTKFNRLHTTNTKRTTVTQTERRRPLRKDPTDE